MTQFKTNFSEYSLDVKPSDWTNRWNASGEEFSVISEVSGTVGDKILQIVETNNDYRGLSWNDLGTPSDVEILSRVRCDNTGWAGLYLHARGDGTVSKRISYSVKLATDDIFIGYYNGGSFVTLDTIHSDEIADDEWYYVRFRVSGESLKTKVWEEHEVEPSSWESDLTDSVVSGEGWVGVGSRSFISTLTYSTDFFTAGTGGDSAPDPDYDPREIRVTQTPLEILKGGTPETRLTQLPLEVLSGTPLNRAYQDSVEILSEVSGERIIQVYQDSYEILSATSPSGARPIVIVIC